MAAFHGLSQFATHLSNCEILLRVDNTTAVSYVNRMGGIRFPNLNKRAQKKLAVLRSPQLVDIRIIPQIERKSGGGQRESRRLKPETEWSLSHSAFQSVVDTFGMREIYLLASNFNYNCPRYISWFQDTQAVAIDAFTVDWAIYNFYAFPPFNLIARVLQKLVRDAATGILVVPFWPSQPWYPEFMSLLVATPVIVKPDFNLWTSHNRPHPLWRELTLVVGLLSGKPSDEKTSHRQPLR